MYRFYLGIAICFTVILTNHLDWFFDDRTYITVFSNTYYFVEPFKFSDILWTVIQKFNVVLLSTGSFLIVTGLLPLISDKFKKEKKIIKITSISIFLIISATYIYQTVKASIMYVQGFRGDMQLISSVVLGVVLIAVTMLFYLSFIIYKRQINKTKQIEFNNKLDDLSLEFHELVEDYKDVEAISAEMHQSDNIIAWKNVTANKVREMYKNANDFLHLIEENKKNINAPQRKKKN